MPYLLFGVGVLLALYALYRVFTRASVAEIKMVILTVLTGVVALALFILSLTGRLPAAIGIVIALWPFIVVAIKKYSDKKQPAPTPLVTRAEALEVLGLKDPVTAEDIESAYKRLMMKVHPDQQGSAWMATKLNAARDFLLKP